MRILLTVLITALPLFSFAKADPKNSELLLNLTKRYRVAKMVRMKMEKTVSSDLTETKKVHTGEIVLSGKKFRLDQTTPEKNLIVFDGSTLWSVQFPPTEFKDSPLQVTKQKIKSGDGNAVLSSLLTQGKITDRFEILSSQKDEKIATYELKAKNTELNVTKIKLKIELEKSLVRELTVWDEVGNESFFLFPHVLFFSSEQKKLFQYSPPKDAQVIQL